MLVNVDSQASLRRALPSPPPSSLSTSLYIPRPSPVRSPSQLRFCRRRYLSACAAVPESPHSPLLRVRRTKRVLSRRRPTEATARRARLIAHATDDSDTRTANHPRHRAVAHSTSQLADPPSSCDRATQSCREYWVKKTIL